MEKKMRIVILNCLIFERGVALSLPFQKLNNSLTIVKGVQQQAEKYIKKLTISFMPFSCLVRN
jgi:hypothetical protein